MKELKDTIVAMNSDNYKHRFIVEYWQTRIRRDKLATFIRKIEIANLTGAEPPKHDCPLELLEDQKYYMECYLDFLEKRAIIEGINLKVEICKVNTTLNQREFKEDGCKLFQ